MRPLAFLSLLAFALVASPCVSGELARAQPGKVDSVSEFSERLRSELHPYRIAAYRIENDEYRKLVAGADAFAHDPQTRRFLLELVGRPGKTPLTMEQAASRPELDFAAEVAGEDRETFLRRLPRIVVFVRRITSPQSLL